MLIPFTFVYFISVLICQYEVVSIDLANMYIHLVWKYKISSFCQIYSNLSYTNYYTILKKNWGGMGGGEGGRRGWC